MLDAKCPKCDKKAEVNDEMTEVNCSFCLTKIPYEEYIEIMKEKALNMGIEFHNNWDKNPYSYVGIRRKNLSDEKLFRYP